MENSTRVLKSELQIFSASLRYVFKSNERSDDSDIGLADFFSGKVLKVSNNYRFAFIHVYAFMNALKYICAFFVQLKFNC